MGIFDKLFAARKPPDPRRERLLANGRITDGVIVEIRKHSDGSLIAAYRYWLNGVEFESTEILTDAQAADRLRYEAGASIAVRYDPRNQINSIIE
jgi:hypothetical protein